jgi:hypothetical protein
MTPPEEDVRDRLGSISFFRRTEKERLEPAPGLTSGKLVGDFRLDGLIGQGGMGQVWEAEQLSLERRVAVKFVRPERVTPHQLELFAREARAGGRLSHHGIVAIHGHGTSDGLAWIAMEFVGGAWTLRDFLDEVAKLPEVPDGYDRHVTRFVAEIADAMHAWASTTGRTSSRSAWCSTSCSRCAGRSRATQVTRSPSRSSPRTRPSCARSARRSRATSR